MTAQTKKDVPVESLIEEDLTAQKAAKAEVVAEGEDVAEDTIDYEFEGVTYKIDKNKYAEDLEILEAFEDGKYILPIKLLLGDAQWLKFKSKGSGAKRYGDFVNGLFETLGAQPGE